MKDKFREEYQNMEQFIDDLSLNYIEFLQERIAPETKLFNIWFNFQVNQFFTFIKR